MCRSPSNERRQSPRTPTSSRWSSSIGGVVVDAIGARALQLLGTVAAARAGRCPGSAARRAASRSQTLSPTTNTSRGRHAQAVDRGQEQVRVWLGAGDHVAGDDRHAVGHAQAHEGGAGRVASGRWWRWPRACPARSGCAGARRRPGNGPHAAESCGERRRVSAPEAAARARDRDRGRSHAAGRG